MDEGLALGLSNIPSFNFSLNLFHMNELLKPSYARNPLYLGHSFNRHQVP